MNRRFTKGDRLDSKIIYLNNDSVNGYETTLFINSIRQNKPFMEGETLIYVYNIN